MRIYEKIWSSSYEKIVEIKTAYSLTYFSKSFFSRLKWLCNKDVTVISLPITIFFLVRKDFETGVEISKQTIYFCAFDSQNDYIACQYLPSYRKINRKKKKKHNTCNSCLFFYFQQNLGIFKMIPVYWNCLLDNYRILYILHDLQLSLAWDCKEGKEWWWPSEDSVDQIVHFSC